MRRRGREVLAILTTFATWAATLGATSDHAHAGEETVARPAMTVELTWSVPGTNEHSPALVPPRQDVTLEVVDGRPLEAVAWPWDADPDAGGPAPTPSGAWRLGSEAKGRVRVRLEASPNATLVVRRGDQTIRMTVAAILEGSPTPPSPGLNVTVQRLPWDALAIDFGPGAENGVAAPGTAVPVTIGYDILQQDAAEVTVRTTAVLRPIGKAEPVWQFEQREVLPANLPEPPSRLWSVPAPAREGAYILEVQAAWEAAGPRENSRISRLIRRRKTPGNVGSASRRVVLAVVSPQVANPPAILGAADSSARATEVDSLDLGRIRNARFSAFGRSPTTSAGGVWEVPAELLIDASRREKEREWFRGFIGKAGAEPARLGAADPSGLAWSAVALRSTHPDKPHRLTATVTAGDAASLGVMILDPGSTDRRPRVLLDACGGGSTGNVPLEWIVWPGSTEPILILLNRSRESDVTVGTVRLSELEPSTSGEPTSSEVGSRAIGVHLGEAGALERFVASNEQGIDDSLATAENLASYLATCGARFVVLPDGLAERGRRRRLAGRLTEDPTGPDRLEVILRVLQRRGMTAWLEPNLRKPGALRDLPPPESAEATQQSLTRIGPSGEAEEGVYQPLHPRVREALKRRVVEVVTERGGQPGFAGVLVRLGSGPTLLGTPDSGMDDDTFSRFVRETFGAGVAREIPGLDANDAGRFKARAQYLAGVGRMPWLAWRSKAVAGLYAELTEAVRKAAPTAVLALSTPTLDDGPSGAEARRVDLAGLPPSQAWRSLGLDLRDWGAVAEPPVMLRGANLSDDGLARDLAAHPDLDSQIVGFPRRGFLLLTEPASAGPDGGRPSATAVPNGDGAASEGPLAHAVSALDAQWIVLGATTVAGREERVRRFAQTFERLPSEARAAVEPAAGTKESGVVVRSLPEKGRTVFEIVNDTPYAMRLGGVVRGDDSAVVEDLGRNVKLAPQPFEGGRRLVVDLAPFGLTVVRVGAGGTTLDKPTLYPSQPVVASMESRVNDINGQLSALNRGASNPIVEPPNAGFEQEPITPASATAGEGQASSAPGGWRIDRGVRSAGLSIDESAPHSGSRCLKLETRQGSASVLSGDFSPGEGSTLLVQTFLRADKEGTSLRIWIEGERRGEPYARRSDVVVGKDWRPLVVKASDLPVDGLETVRLRFESTAPGSVWIDDVRVRGEVAPKAVRLNAQRTLLAALQAYRERRYAEFTRLADSHWARHPGVMALVRGERNAPAADDSAKATEASALPPDRALR
ncbi:hypothetical protein [Paludisphaera rhizosphaerae]|uniref:hypothetical protein n=1 Tax=Paludisphaera rhizosphaerae TaxID=2711216 RepID=UPI0013E9DC71|nr:hypothetical protein [Paludisphaera rhizosphaerae]